MEPTLTLTDVRGKTRNLFADEIEAYYPGEHGTTIVFSVMGGPLVSDVFRSTPEQIADAIDEQIGV